jgi:hypothetical protein
LTLAAAPVGASRTPPIGQGARIHPIVEDARMPLQRIAWLITVGAALITALLLFVSGYNGYGALAIAVGAAAAINLR